MHDHASERGTGRAIPQVSRAEARTRPPPHPLVSHAAFLRRLRDARRSSPSLPAAAQPVKYYGQDSVFPSDGGSYVRPGQAPVTARECVSSEPPGQYDPDREASRAFAGGNTSFPGVNPSPDPNATRPLRARSPSEARPASPTRQAR